MGADCPLQRRIVSLHFLLESESLINVLSRAKEDKRCVLMSKVKMIKHTEKLLVLHDKHAMLPHGNKTRACPHVGSPYWDR